LNFGVAHGVTCFVFSSDLTSEYTSRVPLTMTVKSSARTTSTSTIARPLIPTISSVSPSTGLQGANLTVTVTGTSFQAGASAAFGAGITVRSAERRAATRVSLGLVMGATSEMGARDVKVAEAHGAAGVGTVDLG